MNGKTVSVKSLKRFAKFWSNLSVKQLNQVKSFKAQSEIVSEHFREALIKVVGEKKPLTSSRSANTALKSAFPHTGNWPAMRMASVSSGVAQ